ncbi:MAG TPA: insulinase family protein, partial [Syntrophobacteria bacterium]|nr:insulinase family protein [Syntrophobacteria bacterium]
ELKTTADLYRHARTGAELLSLSNKDENKVFAIIFRTPPTDGTGVAHILEHSVLCGSRKYPVREPFVELLKGSLQTFLNAFTYPDKTCYPVASQNLQDFYNLIDVYLDAVLYPRLTPYTLQQEGWHLELDDPSQPLSYKGVVFNEMKGAYSSPDRVLAECSQQSLFPDHTYGLDAGGDPREIPNLTFERFTAFHERYYHPSNSRIFFYGDDPPEERLRIVDAYLKDFSPLAVASEIPRVKPLGEPRRLVRPFAVTDAKAKGMVTVNWLLPETTDTEAGLTFRMLNYMLLGMPASPLRKALIDSGLGEDLAGGGLEDELRHMYFSTGLKGINVTDAAKVESVIRETLTRLAKEGIDPLTVEAAVNTIEFRLRENHSGSYPRGLLLLLRSLVSWLYGGDPLAPIAFEAPLLTVKAKLASERSFLPSLIERFFLENPHRTTLILEPDPALSARQEADEQKRLTAARAAMTLEGLAAVVAATRELKERQQAPDPPEALAAIPTLRLSDLERKNKTIPLTPLERQGAQILYHDLFTNGILYLDLGFNLHGLPQQSLPFVRLFGRALLEMGTETEDFVSLSQRISRKTGGIVSKSFNSAVRGSREAASWLFLRAKAMKDQAGELLAILRDVLLTVRLDNRARFRQMVLEEKARQEERLVPEGHHFVNLRLRSHFSEADWASEQMQGVSYLEFLHRLARAVDDDWPGLLLRLEELRRALVNRGCVLTNITIHEGDWREVEPRLREFLDLLPAASTTTVHWSPEAVPGCEGLTIPAQVNFVGKGANLYDLGYRFHGSAKVVTRYLRTAWLWERIRVQGGAYGAFCLFSQLSGVLTFVSYRDPNLLKTLEAFDQTVAFLRTVELTEDELTKSIIGTIGDLDTYLLPDAKGFTSMVWHLTGETREARQRLRDEVLGTTVGDFRAFADALQTVAERGLIKVLGPEGAIRAAAPALPCGFEMVKVL